MWLYEIGRQYQTIIEVGGGRSTFALLSGNWKGWQYDGRVYCVDCWPSKVKGTHDEFDPRIKDMDRRSEFWAVCGRFPNLNVIELPSRIASMGIPPAAVVFLDGGTKNMLQDIDFWWNVAGKIVCGHDYSDKYPELQAALSVRFGCDLNLVGKDSSIWWVEKW